MHATINTWNSEMEEGGCTIWKLWQTQHVVGCAHSTQYSKGVTGHAPPENLNIELLMQSVLEAIRYY